MMTNHHLRKKKMTERKKRKILARQIAELMVEEFRKINLKIEDMIRNISIEELETLKEFTDEQQEDTITDEA